MGEEARRLPRLYISIPATHGSKGQPSEVQIHTNLSQKGGSGSKRAEIILLLLSRRLQLCMMVAKYFPRRIYGRGGGLL